MQRCLCSHTGVDGIAWSNCSTAALPATASLRSITDAPSNAPFAAVAVGAAGLVVTLDAKCNVRDVLTTLTTATLYAAVEVTTNSVMAVGSSGTTIMWS